MRYSMKQSLGVFALLSGRTKSACWSALSSLRTAGFIERSQMPDGTPATSLGLARLLLATTTPRLNKNKMIASVEDAQNVVDADGRPADVGIAQVLEKVAAAKDDQTSDSLMVAENVPEAFIYIEARFGRLHGVAFSVNGEDIVKFTRMDKDKRVVETSLLALIGPLDVKRIASFLIDRNETGPGAATPEPGQNQEASVTDVCQQGASGSERQGHSATATAAVQFAQPPTANCPTTPLSKPRGVDGGPHEYAVPRRHPGTR